MEYEEEEEEEEEGVGYNESAVAKSKSNKVEAAAVGKHKYKECLKNQAVGIGGHATDGCGEFMAAGEEGSLESLKCAACSCHRNFHRRENHQQQLLLAHFGYRNHNHPSSSGYFHLQQQQQQQLMRPLALALPSTSREEMQREEYYAGKKRFRTKFTAEQKERMRRLAESLEWKIQKQDEDLVQQFCSELGIKRHVFKVWMHNNKTTHAKKT